MTTSQPQPSSPFANTKTTKTTKPSHSLQPTTTTSPNLSEQMDRVVKVVNTKLPSPSQPQPSSPFANTKTTKTTQSSPSQQPTTPSPSQTSSTTSSSIVLTQTEQDIKNFLLSNKNATWTDDVTNKKHITLVGYLYVVSKYKLNILQDAEYKIVEISDLSSHLPTKHLIAMATTTFTNDKGEVVGKSSMMCDSTESYTSKHSGYVVISLAQTRSFVKGARMKFGALIEKLGFDSLAYEELDR